MGAASKGKDLRSGRLTLGEIERIRNGMYRLGWCPGPRGTRVAIPFPLTFLLQACGPLKTPLLVRCVLTSFPYAGARGLPSCTRANSGKPRALFFFPSRNYILVNQEM